MFVAKLLAAFLRNVVRGLTRLYDHHHTVADLGQQAGVRQGHRGRRVQDNPVEKRSEAPDERLETSAPDQLRRVGCRLAAANEKQPLLSSALENGEHVRFTPQVLGNARIERRSQESVHSGEAKIGVD